MGKRARIGLAKAIRGAVAVTGDSDRERLKRRLRQQLSPRPPARVRGPVTGQETQAPEPAPAAPGPADAPVTGQEPLAAPAGPSANQGLEASPGDAGTAEPAADEHGLTPRGAAPGSPGQRSRSAAAGSVPPAPTGGSRPVPVVLEAAVDGAEEDVNGGIAYVIRTRVASLAGGSELEKRYAATVEDPAAPMRALLQARDYAEPANHSDFVFLDIETAGLGNVPVFLVGIMVWRDGGLEVIQYMARDYAEEGTALALCHHECVDRGLLVTFNGKSFDMPCLRSRATMSRLAFTWNPCHLDLLHESRRVWRDVLPNCKLQTLEQFVCRRFRQDDIPGSQIPDVYHHFVHTGDAHLIIKVLEHNVWDLVTLADLLMRLPAPPE
jgi:uncharacterized protein YprB with RNaseH-like and TPR domain